MPSPKKTGKRFAVLSVDTGEMGDGSQQLLALCDSREEAEEICRKEAEAFWEQLEEDFGENCWQVWDLSGEGVVSMASDDGNYGARFTIWTAKRLNKH